MMLTMMVGSRRCCLLAWRTCGRAAGGAVAGACRHQAGEQRAQVVRHLQTQAAARAAWRIQGRRRAVFNTRSLTVSTAAWRAQDASTTTVKTASTEDQSALDGPSKVSQFKRILELAQHEKALLLGSLGLLVGSSSITLALPKLMGVVLDIALDPVASVSTSTLSFGLLGLFGAQAVMMLSRLAMQLVAGERISARLRQSVFEALMRRQTSFFDVTPTGELTNRLSADCLLLQKTITSSLSQGVRSGMLALGSIGMMMHTSPQLLGLALIALPPLAGTAVYLGRRMKRRQEQVQQKLADSTALATEVLANIRVVREFASERHEISRYGERVSAVKRDGIKVGLLQSLMDSSIFLGANVGLIAVMAYGSQLVTEGAITAGDLTSFLMYSVYLGVHAGSLSNVGADFMRSLGASQKLFQLLDASVDDTSTLSSQFKPIRFTDRIQFSNVHFAYPSRPTVPVLTDFNLTIHRGETVALVGASGSGKSTVARLLTRLYHVDHGAITLDGQDIRTIDVGGLRACVGVVPQEPALFSATLRENIAYGCPDATQQQIEDAAERANALDFIHALPNGFETEVGERGVSLSGGQKQRIAIARALVRNPQLLILDEATSALDATSEAGVHKALVNATRGRTAVVIAHRLSTILNADTIAVVDEGGIVEQGTFTQLMQRNGQFAQLIAHQHEATTEGFAPFTDTSATR
ncbi:ABC protein [Salpingoeca rosetta]|uniref:ABC protein n=1 Tax=Salpingoeca rosetta (strain ATCC 50818 / BSB-021) TaxID=946362 RepID=F2UC12_SALR5|nr:ABC protein [Salpingoeca rosetta]EGD74119.1 ABC protein [Salpingoeca rosetta]|eukprot:XP_004993020.1 ABC protein [Salpingoeca rosetta]